MSSVDNKLFTISSGVKAFKSAAEINPNGAKTIFAAVGLPLLAFIVILSSLPPCISVIPVTLKTAKLSTVSFNISVTLIF